MVRQTTADCDAFYVLCFLFVKNRHVAAVTRYSQARYSTAMRACERTKKSDPIQLAYVIAAAVYDP